LLILQQDKKPLSSEKKQKTLDDAVEKEFKESGELNMAAL